MFGFVIWLGACGISSIFFIGEFLFWPLKNRKMRRNEIKKAKCAKVHPINPEQSASQTLNNAKHCEKILKKFRVKQKLKRASTST